MANMYFVLYSASGFMFIYSRHTSSLTVFQTLFHRLVCYSVILRLVNVSLLVMFPITSIDLSGQMPSSLPEHHSLPRSSALSSVLF